MGCHQSYWVISGCVNQCEGLLNNTNFEFLKLRTYTTQVRSWLQMLLTSPVLWVTVPPEDGVSVDSVGCVGGSREIGASCLPQPLHPLLVSITGCV